MSELKLPRILAIDDESVWLDQVPLILEEIGTVDSAVSIDEGLKLIRDNFYDIILLDLNFSGDSRTGLDIFRAIHALDRGADVIVISGETHPQRLIEVFNVGVTRFIPKPATPSQIRNEVRSVLSQRELKRQVLLCQTNGGKSNATNPFVGNSAAIQRLKTETNALLRAGVRDVLILGETGSGKEILSRFIAHEMDPSKRFLPIHCGAISDGLAESELFGHVKGAFTGADRDRVGVFEAAAGGFVFLDEIGEMPLNQQAKLLRVIQERIVQRVGSYEERKVNFRTIAATHVDLEAAIRQKKFREDLYYRIAKGILRLPALRERREDIPALIQSFNLHTLKDMPLEFTPGAIELLQAFDWPGNVRQLRNTLENLAARLQSPIVREKDVCVVLPEASVPAGPGLTRGPMGSYGYSLLATERRKFERALEEARGNRDEAAKLLGLSRATYFRRAKEMGLIRQRRL